MEKSVLKQIILNQQEFVRKVRVCPRDISLDPNANYVLVGMRRAGKSYLLYQHIQHLLAAGHEVEEMLFVNFEDERIADIRKEELHLILEAYRELFPHEPFIFLDEIQNVAGWEHFARRLADEKRRVFITGSNAHMLSREIGATLGGRYLTKEVFPFSFAEYLRYHDVVLTDHWALSPMRADVVRSLPDYFFYGGLSEVFDMQDKRAWLQSLYHKVLYSDIVTRKAIRAEQSLRLLVRKLADSVMQPMAVKRLQNILQGDGTRISRATITAYLDYMADAYLTFALCNFASPATERENIKKHYFFDNGLLNLFLFQPEAKLLENLVAIHLYQKHADRLFYYNRNVEVDFCVPSEGLLVQAAYSIADPATLERETAALIKVGKFLKASKFVIVTYNEERTLEQNGLTIDVVPVWRFLVE